MEAERTPHKTNWMSGNMILIAGPNGGNSTFAGGLLYHIDKSDGYNTKDTIEGNEQDYH